MYFVANGTAFEFPLAVTGSESWAVSSTKYEQLDSAVGAATVASPGLDYTNHLFYVGGANRIYKVEYPFTGKLPISTALFRAGQDKTYPHSSPLVFNGVAFLGDGKGFPQQYATCASMADLPFKAVTD